ncbi:hypothetical protein Tco_1299259 [Tanacetum coccineum]
MTQSTAMYNDPLSPKIGSGDSPRRQETMGVLLLRLGIDGNLYLIDKKGSCLRVSKDCSRQSDHQIEIEGQEAKKEEKGKNSTTYEEKTEDVEGETVHTATTRVSAISAPVTTAGVAISTVEPRTPPTTTATAFIDEDLTIAQTLIKMKEEKAKKKGVVVKDVKDSPRPIRSITTLQPLPTINPKDKELAELDRAQKERQNQEEATSAALVEEFDDIQARIDVDHELAKQLAAERAERAEEIRNKPPIRTQVRNKMITYLKHMGKYTHQQLKNKNFKEVQKLYEREKKWIDDFKPIDDDSQQQEESTKKRPRADSKEESSKKQKLEEDNDAEKRSLERNYKIFSEMLDDFDRQDVLDLHRFVNERYETTSPEGYDLLLLGDLKTLFEPNEEDEI